MSFSTLVGLSEVLLASLVLADWTRLKRLKSSPRPSRSVLGGITVAGMPSLHRCCLSACVAPGRWRIVHILCASRRSEPGRLRVREARRRLPNLACFSPTSPGRFDRLSTGAVAMCLVAGAAAFPSCGRVWRTDPFEVDFSSLQRSDVPFPGSWDDCPNMLRWCLRQTEGLR